MIKAAEKRTHENLNQFFKVRLIKKIRETQRKSAFLTKYGKLFWMLRSSFLSFKFFLFH